MRRATPLQRTLIAALSVSAALLLVTVNLPHRHDGPVASHPAQSCAVCRIQSNFSATPPAPVIVQGISVAVALTVLPREAVPCALRVVRLSVPRAPPQLS